MAWNYAELSKAAKKAGGPERFLKLIEEGGKSTGRIEGMAAMVPWIVVAAVGSSAVTAGIISLIDHFKAEKTLSQEAVEAAKSELIQGIKEYDVTHPEKMKEEISEKGEEFSE